MGETSQTPIFDNIEEESHSSNEQEGDSPSKRQRHSNKENGRKTGKKFEFHIHTTNLNALGTKKSNREFYF
jgi:hypothetical protein